VQDKRNAFLQERLKVRLKSKKKKRKESGLGEKGRSVVLVRIIVGFVVFLRVGRETGDVRNLLYVFDDRYFVDRVYGVVC
jgi:hypothetical protein